VVSFFSTFPAAVHLGAAIPALLAFFTGEFSIGLPDLVVLATGKFSAYSTTGSILFACFSLSGDDYLSDVF
jgi:hypothetical protein